MENFTGARFFKCDLQMQTPADSKHWMGEAFDVINDPEGAARDYIARCYEVGLEAIAITEHNFLSKDFIPYLQQQAKLQAKDYQLVIFPGFEMTANVGQGVHILAIFDPKTNLTHIDRILSACGVPAERQNSSGDHLRSEKDLKYILSQVQKRTEENKMKGIIVAPHIKSNSGLFDNDKVAEWLQQQEFTNPELLCVEVPKSPQKMSDGFKKLFGIMEGCDPSWKRERDIACIMSSDAKSLTPNERTTNYIGSRYSWIKMSSPTVEGLRQSFIDSSSRIKLCDLYPNNPDEQYQHPFIERLSINGVKFLSNQNIYFSKNLNTIIGGRGTGKSTVLEYIRRILERESEIIPSKKTDYQALMGTVSDTSHFELVFNKGGAHQNERWKIEVNGRRDPVLYNTEGKEEIADIRSFLPVNIYSKGQIEAIADDPTKQRNILDDFIKTEMRKLRSDEQTLILQLRDLISKFSREPSLKKDELELLAEVRNLQGKISRIETFATPIKVWRKWEKERRYIETVEADLKALVSRTVNSDTTDVGSSPVTMKTVDDLVPEFSSEFSNIEFFAEFRESYISLLKEFDDSIKAAAETALEKMKSVKSLTSHKSWSTEYNSAKSEYDAALEKLREANIDPESHQNLLDQLADRQLSLANVQAALKEVADISTLVNLKYTDELLPIWRKQSQLRMEIAKQINQAVPKTKNGLPTVSISVSEFADKKSFLDLMETMNRDRRKISDTEWQDFMSALFDSALGRSMHPAELLEIWQAEINEKNFINVLEGAISTQRQLSICSFFSKELINKLKLERVDDFVKVTLHRREDGREVGTLDGRTLSAGQRATAVLTIILAIGEAPILIDQPEDDLDNEFVYKQLVPVLRESKEKRQIIVATHNANIPVNGDAELILPLEVRSSKGAQKEIRGKSCVGGLDRNDVQTAVEEILEGSAEAFQKRKEKYGF